MGKHVANPTSFNVAYWWLSPGRTRRASARRWNGIDWWNQNLSGRLRRRSWWRQREIEITACPQLSAVAESAEAGCCCVRHVPTRADVDGLGEDDADLLVGQENSARGTPALFGAAGVAPATGRTCCVRLDYVSWPNEWTASLTTLYGSEGYQAIGYA